MSNVTNTYNELISRLKEYRTRQKALFFSHNLCRVLAILLAVFLLLLLAETILDFTPQLLIVIAILFTFAAALALLWQLGSFFLLFVIHSQKPSLNDIALQVGSFYKKTDDRLANALQLIQRYYGDTRYSRSLIEESLNISAGALQDHDFKNFLDRKPFFRSVKYVLAALIITGIFSLFLGTQFNTALLRYTHPYLDSRGRQAHFIVLPGHVTALRNTDIPVKIWVSDSAAQNLSLHFSDREPVVLTKTGADTFYYTIPEVKETFSYHAEYRRFSSPDYKVTVEERPLLRTLKIQITPPAYSKITPWSLDDNVGDISALKGAQITLTGQTNKPVQSAMLLFAGGAKITARVEERSFSAKFTIWQNDTYIIDLVDESGNHSDKPITYTIRVIPDQYPLVDIVQPGKDIDLGDDMTIPLLIEARDDYGVSLLRLAYQVLPQGDEQIDSSRFVLQKLQGFDYGKDILRVGLDWDLSTSDLMPTDVVVYYVEGYDNDTISGPKRAVSKMYRARFPSLYEIYQDITANQDNVIEGMEDVFQQEQELQKQIADLAQEMKRATEVNWEKQQEAEEILKNRQDMQEKLQDLAADLNEMVDKMQNENLVSAETIKKFQEVQELYKEIMTPEMEQLMREMAQALENMDRNLLQKALEEFKLSEEEFNKNLDKTISLLKRLKIEQQLDQAQKMAENLAERQENVADKTAENADMERLLKEQQNIDHDKQALGEMLQDLQKEMSATPAMPEQEVAEAMNTLESDSLNTGLQNLEEMLQSGNLSKFDKTSKQVQNRMQQVSQQLLKAKNSMSGAQQQKAFAELKKNSRQILELSKQQEEVMQKTGDPMTGDEQVTDIAEKQQEIRTGLGRVTDNVFRLSKENFAIDPGIYKALGLASMQMDDAVSALEERNNTAAANNQGNAVTALNQAMHRIQASMQNMMQGGGMGMSFQQFMEQMQQMAKGQQGINEQTLGMGLGKGLSMAQQAQMARLSAEQGQMRKSMEQLANEAKGLSEVLGDLGNMAQEMQQVENDLNRNIITRETITRQNRILSRMLDAQKSIREREYSRKRQAERGKDYFATSPDELDENLGERENRLQQALLQAKKEGYTRDYLELIKQYFEALTRQNEKNGN
ncbi:MAG TPA: hypothetical protein PLP19_03720 [bacterium]|nr:hypothetical protein [bacterium]HPN42576.1 hypothetical protein [bacterium]